MARFGIVGAGWRVNWFLRAARALPDKLQVAGLAARRPQRAFDLAAAYGVNIYRSPAEMIAAEAPDFVVTSVSWPANPHIIRQLVEQDMPVLSETPPAEHRGRNDRTMGSAGAGRTHPGRRTVPSPAPPRRPPRLRPQRPSRTHQPGPTFGLPTATTASVSYAVSSASVPSPPPSLPAASPLPSCRAPAVTGPAPRTRKLPSPIQLLATFDFGDRLGILDFTPDQYFSWIRGQRLLLRGDRGEIIDDQGRLPARLPHSPSKSLSPATASALEGNLEGNYLKGIQAGEHWWYRNPTLPAELTDDENRRRRPPPPHGRIRSWRRRSLLPRRSLPGPLPRHPRRPSRRNRPTRPLPTPALVPYTNFA